MNDVYEDFDFFKSAINKMKAKDHQNNLENAKMNDTTQMKKTFTMISDATYSNEIKLITKLSGKHYSIKEIETQKTKMKKIRITLSK